MTWALYGENQSYRKISIEMIVYCESCVQRIKIDTNYLVKVVKGFVIVAEPSINSWT